MASKITKIGVTSNKISGRGGLSFILRYISQIGLYGLINENVLVFFQSGSGKGLQLPQFLKQMFAFFIDGTDMSISGFDHKKQDEGYAAVLENTPDQLASSHQIKRFFIKFIPVKDKIFNKILHTMFIWRLKITKPDIIELGIDTMVLNNDDATKREGNEVTYKKVKGFQPLHICWGTFLVDVLFRKGSAHSNHGTDFIDRVTSIVNLIRKEYNAEIPIILNADGGFRDQKAFEYLEQTLGIHYIITGKVEEDIKDYIRQVPSCSFDEITKGSAVWQILEIGNRLKSWTKFRRCIFTRLHRDDAGQYIMDFSKPDNVIYTNIGNCAAADDKLRQAGYHDYFSSKTIVEKSHQRGADELIHRSIKELATKEQLPFKKFGMNRTYYFLLVITHFIFEAYKQDVTSEIISIHSYPNTFRRKLIDFAVKITSGSREIILNVTKTVYETLNITQIWKKCQSPPVICSI